MSDKRIPAGAALLKDWQRQRQEARLLVLNHIRAHASVVGRSAAISQFLSDVREAELPEAVRLALALANARRGRRGARSVSRRSLYRWFNQERGGPGALAPKSTERASAPAWAQALLKLYRRPNKPPLRRCVAELPAMLAPGTPSPSYHACLRYLSSLSKLEQKAGRLGRRALKSLLPFVRRDTSKLLPGDVYTADGHRFDAEVAHPRHGRPFRPEIASIIDVATRRVVGWSVDVTESGLAVLDAIRHACTTSGDFAVFYTDRGSGYHNALLSQPGIGMMARLGFTITHSLPYNSQARGISERSHQTIWVAAARELPTFIGASMDPEAKGKVFKLVRRGLRSSGASRLLMSWPDFLSYCAKVAAAYNARPHSALPEAQTPEGARRSMSPDEAWADGIKRGATIRIVSDEESIELFRPVRECKVQRGEIRLFNNIYFSADLTHYHADTVRVAFDIHDASRVWVRDTEGRFICEAQIDANRADYFPESFIERSRRERVLVRLKRTYAKVELLRDDIAPSHDGDADLPAKRQALRLVSAPRTRPAFSSEYDRYVWLMENRAAWSSKDEAWLSAFARDPLYEVCREKFEEDGIAWYRGSEKR